MLLNYLSRAHQYRTGQLQVADRALVYIDDDWYNSAWEWDQNVGLLYPNRVFIRAKETTRAADYRPRVDSAPYQWIQLCAHSWPGGHCFTYDHGRERDWFYAIEIDTLEIEACFCNLFACSNVRFVEPGYCGGRYVFQTRAGLGAIGSCKTGSMLEFQDFYGPLGNGLPLALAFHEWFDHQAQGGFEAWERSWFYGMCLIADGLLKPRWTVGVEQPPAQLPLACHIRSLQTPVRDMLGLELVLNRPTHARLRLVDRIGRTVSSVHDGRLEPGTHLVNVDVSRIPAGVYFLLLDTDTGPSCKPITIIH